MQDISVPMSRALALAERGGGGTAPNPMVGCVILGPDGAVVGEGYHARAGGPHAEIAAMDAARRAGRPLADSTFVVTLEPCAAYGRTPPCVDAIVAAGARAVRFALEDPAEGKGGAARLGAAGVLVERGDGEAEAGRLLEAWLHFVATGRPFFHVKMARTESGHVTRGAGSARWITSPESRAAVHRLRHRHPAVMAGIGTVLADDPELTVRDWPPAGEVGWPDVQPRRVVLDSALRLPLDARLLATLGAAPVLVFCVPGAAPARRSALEARGVEVVPVEADGLRVDLRAVAGELAARDVTGVLVEPGPTLLAALGAAGLIDRWTTFTSPDRTHAADALHVPDPGFALRDVERERVGPDVLVTGRVSGGGIL